jgi:hypothetical protein
MRKGLTLVILSFIAAGLAACASPEQQRQIDTAACQRYGFQAGTPDFATCLQREQLARDHNTGSSVGVGVGGGSYGGGGFGGIGMGFGF